jgi:hypothetical protein
MARKPEPTDRFLVSYEHGRGYLITDRDPNVCKVYGPYETQGVAEFHRAKLERLAASERERKGAR